MENKEIIQKLKLTASLMELHNENPFKIRGYQTAAFNLERVDGPLEDMSLDELEQIEGVGKSVAAKIMEIVETGTFPVLQQLQDTTPEGLLDLLALKGFGAKKIRTLWMELGITNEDELLAACNENQVAELKGFGAKSQDGLRQAILNRRQNKGLLLYAKAERIARELVNQFPDLELVGELRRKTEIVKTIELLTSVTSRDEVLKILEANGDLIANPTQSGPLTWKGEYQPTKTDVAIHFAREERKTNDLLLFTGSKDHLTQLVDGRSLMDSFRFGHFNSEVEAYGKLGLPFIPPELREGMIELEMAKKGSIGDLIKEDDLKGILHNHSTYSDGRNTLEAMANYCKELGYQYLGITDHSKSSFYANGLSEERILEQHQEIDRLNEQLKPFKIFKGIEVDIHFDGSLDYDDEVLASFDFTVISIHTNMVMDEKKATERLIKAISHPASTLLGHPTGRLLLGRDGYPIDHKAVIDACAAYGVVIEINANPNRLDLDWRWIPYALNQKVTISVNPDAHRREGYHDMQYGIEVARKGGLTAENTLNAMSLDEIGHFFRSRKEKKGLLLSN